MQVPWSTPAPGTRPRVSVVTPNIPLFLSCKTIVASQAGGCTFLQLGPDLLRTLVAGLGPHPGPAAALRSPHSPTYLGSAARVDMGESA